MTTAELESKLSGQAETQNIEFKAAYKWDVNFLAKDILALSNVRDGGYIIIGVEDKTFQRIGVDEEVKKSYNRDIMLDQMSKFAIPSVDFYVLYPKDKDGLTYVIIHVLEFKEMPVVCRKGTPQSGTQSYLIYYRNSNRRPESAPVSNHRDLEDIIERATVKKMKKLKQLGLDVEPTETARDKLNKELEGL